MVAVRRDNGARHLHPIGTAIVDGRRWRIGEQTCVAAFDVDDADVERLRLALRRQRRHAGCDDDHDEREASHESLFQFTDFDVPVANDPAGGLQ